MTAPRIEWSDHPDDEIREGVCAVIDAATAADGTAPVGDEVLRALTRPDGSSHGVVRGGDGTIRGYAHVAPAVQDGVAMAEAVVAPAARRGGLGRLLVENALERGGPGTRIWAHGDLEPARALARSAGLRGVRELLQLRRPFAADESLDPTVPAGVTVRTYGGSQDDAELLRVNNAAFAWHPEQGDMTEADLAEQRGERWFDPEGLFLAFDPADGEGSRLLGFHWTKAHPPRGDEPALGEVYVLGIDPAAQGRGLGRALTLVGLRHLRDRGLPAVLLYVEGDNEAALRTYRGLGFTRFHTDLAYARAD